MFPVRMARMLGIVLGTAAACVLAAAPTADAAALSFRRVGATTWAVATDGSRYAAFRGARGRTIVFDTKRDTQRTFDTPHDCYGSLAPPVVGSGLVLWATKPCDRPEGDLDLEILNLGTGARTKKEVWGQFGGADVSYPIAIGRRWIQLIAPGYHTKDRVFLNWHTGASYFERDMPGGRSRKRVPDLDTRTVWQRPCRGLHRETDPNNDPYNNTPPLLEFSYASPFGLSFAGDYASTEQFALYRCGKAGALLRCGKGCVHEQLGSGLLSWYASKPKRVRLYDPTRHRSFSWTPPGELFSVGHTATRVFAAVHDNRTRATALYAAPIPRH